MKKRLFMGRSNGGVGLLLLLVLATSFVGTTSVWSMQMQQEEGYEESSEVPTTYLKPCEFDLFGLDKRAVCKGIIASGVKDVKFGPAGQVYVLHNYDEYIGGSITAYTCDGKIRKAEKPFAKNVRNVFINQQTDCVYVLHHDKTVSMHTFDGKLSKSKLLFKDVWDFYINPKTGYIYVKDFLKNVTMYTSDSKKGTLLAKNVEIISFNSTTGYAYVLGECFWSCGGPVSVYAPDGNILNDGNSIIEEVVAFFIAPKTGLVYTLHWDTSVKVYSSDSKKPHDGKLFAEGVRALFIDPKIDQVYISYLDASMKVYSSDGQVLNAGKPFTKGVSSIFFSPTGDMFILYAKDNTLVRYTQEHNASVECLE